MAINLNKNRDSMLLAWKDVLNDKTDTDWALFGYEGQTNDLRFVSKGFGGIEELREDLNSGKVMYAFVKVNDPKTSLDKFVLINWQGEGTNTVRKGLCANHLRDVEKFFTGAQITYTARNEDEMEPQLIVGKVMKAAATSYSFKAPKSETPEPSGPVGTTYQRVNPIKEINSKERDQFWRREEEEEKRRIEEEKRGKEEERVKLEQEAKRRELEDYSKREAEATMRNNNIDQVKEAENISIQTQPIPPTYIEEEVPKVNQSDLLRKQRKQEAQDLISQRTFDARSVFEKNTSVTHVKKTPEKPVRNSILKAQAQAQSFQENNKVEARKVESIQTYSNKMESTKTEVITTQYLEPERVSDEPSDEEDSDQFSTIKRSPRDAEKKSSSTPTTPQDIINNAVNKQEAAKNDKAKEQGRELDNELVYQITDQQFVDEYLYGFTTPGLQARALYDYQAADDTEITFDPGDLITNIDQVDEGWWQGLGPDGTYGLFPANYVELLN